MAAVMICRFREREKPPYNLCWECNRKFHGYLGLRVTLLIDGREVFVHASCADQMSRQGRIQ